MPEHLLRRCRSFMTSLFLCCIVTLGVPLVGDVHAEVPVLGAQVWIEPGQTEKNIDRWFEILADHDMPFARLFIQWNFIEPQPDTWDFT